MTIIREAIGPLDMYFRIMDPRHLASQHVAHGALLVCIKLPSGRYSLNEPQNRSSVSPRFGLRPTVPPPVL